jgi:hypothetical protein
VARLGAAALLDARIADELVAAVGRVAGGLLGRPDLEEARPVVAACAVSRLGELRVARLPWEPAAAESASVRIVAAADGRGLVAIACYEARQDGVEVAELGLLAPAFAEPVARGEARVRPGEPRPAAGPMALTVAEDGSIEVVAGGAGESALLAAMGRGEALDAALAQVRDVCGVARSRAGARAFRAAP